MEAIGVTSFPAYFDAPIQNIGVYNPGANPVSLSTATRTPVNLPKEGVSVMNPTIQAAKAAFGVAGGGSVSLPPITSSAQSGEAKSGSGDISSTFRSGDIAFGSTPLGSSANINMVLMVVGIAFVALVILKKKK